MRLVALVLTAGLTLASDLAHADPPSQRLLDIDLKAADVRNVIRLLADVSKRTANVDPCVHGTVDMKLQNVPVKVIMDLLASKLALQIDEHDDTIDVTCGAADATSILGKRVTFTANNVPLDEAVKALGDAANVEGVDYRTTERPVVTVSLKDVRTSTAIAVLADAGNAKIHLGGKRLIVDARR